MGSLLFLLLAAATLDADATRSPTENRFAIRQLVCRGKPGIDLRIHQRPSPADARYLRMALKYERAANAGENYENLAPGTCTWNPRGFKDIPVETGVVYFDIMPHAQRWSATETRQMDTTLNAAIFFPDTITLPRYLSRSESYWLFYVDDQTNFSNSYGATKHTATAPTYVTITGALNKASPAMAELRCRGGASGLSFARGSSAGENRVNVSMVYRLADLQAGTEAQGLTPGTCAWVKRAGIPREPGKIEFVTAGNAQIVQARTGGTIDRSETAAARYPDANTIPVYMQNPAHYWNFQVAVPEVYTARQHAAWRPPIGIGARVPGQNPTVRSQPQTIGNRERQPGTNPTAKTATLVDPPLTFRGLVRKPNEYWMRFSARSNSTPTVEYSTEAPTRINGRLGFKSPQRMIVRSLSQENFIAQYSTAPLTTLPPATKYYFVINVPAGQDGQSAREYSGEFTTMTRMVIARFTRIHVLNDSDKNSAGDLSFKFALTPAPNRDIACATTDNCRYQIDHVTIETDESHTMDHSLFMYTGAPAIRVWVNGADNDNEMGDAARSNWVLYGTSGSSGTFYDRNTASGEIDASRYQPGTRYPFKLRSVDGSVFMFEIHGDVEVRWR